MLQHGVQGGGGSDTAKRPDHVPVGIGRSADVNAWLQRRELQCKVKRVLVHHHSMPAPLACCSPVRDAPQTRSKIPAAPCPMPTHIDTML